jgi:hypothetical protein
MCVFLSSSSFRAFVNSESQSIVRRLICPRRFSCGIETADRRLGGELFCDVHSSTDTGLRIEQAPLARPWLFVGEVLRMSGCSSQLGPGTIVPDAVGQ